MSVPTYGPKLEDDEILTHIITVMAQGNRVPIWFSLDRRRTEMYVDDEILPWYDEGGVIKLKDLNI
jgi:hypothetical protein